MRIDPLQRETQLQHLLPNTLHGSFAGVSHVSRRTKCQLMSLCWHEGSKRFDIANAKPVSKHFGTLYSDEWKCDVWRGWIGVWSFGRWLTQQRDLSLILEVSSLAALSGIYIQCSSQKYQLTQWPPLPTLKDAGVRLRSSEILNIVF
jgi:hypothetical protein